MNESLKKFQDLLRELFQFDCSDMDFGIYRIMNHKRDVIDQFIAEDLPNAIAGELDSGALVEQSRAVEELAEVADQIKNDLAKDAIDADGKLVKFQDTDIGKRYLNLQSKAAGSRGRDVLEVTIFNHLYAFFSRYYQEGDFISKRRYSKNQRYAIPYNGEEVYLYWANSDQYYVKTAEYFHDYTYEAPNGITVHFKVQAANVEQDNVKGDKRFFLPCIEAITYDENANRLEIPFEYRPLTTQEEITYGKRNQQETILTQALTEIPEKIKKMQEPYSKAQSAFRKWLRSRSDLSKAEQTYNTFDDNGHVFRSDNMSATDRRTHEKFYMPLHHPVTRNPCPVPEYGWRYTPETMNRLLKQNLILFGADHTVMPRKKTLLEMTDSSQLPTIYKSGKRGKTDLDDLFLEFPFSHPVDFYTYILDAASEGTATILDYFAGSGTTGHAIINLNREDGGRRKFILVEMGEYFDTVLMPRIKKVTFTPEWKEGKPKCMATPEEAERSPRIVKYMRLESYEDALNNIAFDETSNQMALEFDDYLLKYMIKWETRASETLLNVEKLSRPFYYKMHIRVDGQTREKVADIPETFNYLMGLHIETRRVYDDDGRYYLVYRGQTREGRRMAVIWRETEGWQKSDFERDKDFVTEQKFSDGVDEIFVNGDSFIREAKALESMFKARMFAETGV